MRVLLVEDDRLNAELARDLLQIDGHDVEHVSDAAGLRRRLDGAPTDVVLMDLLLPDGNGADLMRELRRRPAWQAAPVVAVTAQALTGDAERLLQAGFDGVLHKPIDTRGFVRSIETLVERKRRG